jgi:hypothetical protein
MMTINIILCEKHPTWTFVIGYVVLFCVTFFIGCFYGILININPNNSWLYQPIQLLCMFMTLLFNAWILELKNRSFMWLFVSFLFPMLWLSNHNKYSNYKQKNTVNFIDKIKHSTSLLLSISFGLWLTIYYNDIIAGVAVFYGFYYGSKYIDNENNTKNINTQATDETNENNENNETTN